MSNQKKINTGKLLVGVAMSIVVLAIGLRFGLYYLRSDGFSGISMMLPFLLIGTILSFLLMSCSFAAWVYQDCKKRNDDGVLWAIIVFFTTPFIGLLVYFLKRSEIKVNCPACKHLVPLKAKYCEECGTKLESMEEVTEMEMEMKHTHHIKYIAMGIICMMLAVGCLTTFIASAVSGEGYNSSVTSSDKVWNLGGISMNKNTYLNGVWKLDFKSASDGFVSQEKMTINNSEKNSLYADIACSTVPENATLILYLVQRDTVKSFDVTNISEPLQYSLNEFVNGEIQVRLQINGVENVVSEIYIK